MTPSHHNTGLSRFAGVAFILAAALGWGLLGPVARLAFEEGVGPLEVAFWRAVMGGSLFAVHALVGKGKLPQRRDIPAFALFALIGGALFFASYQLAVREGGASLAAVLLYTAPVWVILAGLLWLRETMTLQKAIAVGLAITGVVLIAGGSGEARYSWAAIAWGLTAGISYASYYVFGKIYFERYSAASAYAVAFPVAAITLLPLVTFTAKSGVAIAALLTIGIVSTYLPYVAYAAGLQRLEASRASIIATAEPLVSAAIAHAWWGERFGLAGYFGGALILGGVVLMAAMNGKVKTEN